ncbi:DUF6927 domain-containing protein [Sphingomonas sp. Leaf4]|uniref:DUF6927 domain-containing protein n=1 Tax=Sphingomonas sp. Leaf4 TaxID=2876553 RepID=UPI001E29033E|nr:hypothetical protein [Sphingomonas sp. Leaf4]
MGWLFMSVGAMKGHDSPKAYLDDQFTYQRDTPEGSTGLRVLASAVVGVRTYYAAVQATVNGEGREIFAVVCLVRWNPRNAQGEHFGYKDLDETMGPFEDECPERIMKLLSPTDNESALQWRRRCLANLRLRARPMTEGMRIRFATPISFTNGYSGTDFIVAKRGRQITFRSPEGGGPYRIGNVRKLAWQPVPVTQVHATRFA